MVQFEYVVYEISEKINGMIRSPNDGVHLETPQAQTQLADMDTGTYTKEASCILSNLRNRVMRLFCQIPSIDIALINLLKSCMAYIYIHISSAD